MSKDPWSSRVHGLLARSGRVLVVQTAGGWALPSVEVETFSDEDLSHAQLAFEGLLRMPVALLRYLSRNVDHETRTLEIVNVLEQLDPDWKPPAGMEWGDAGSLPDEQRQLVERSLAETDVPPERAPWARAGWLAEASAWIEQSLAALGRPVTGRIQQVRVWSLSCVLRAPTSDGDVYFKATAGSPLFVNEGRVMRGLARLSKHVPRPLAIDTTHRWMLLDDFGPAVGWDAPLDERQLVHRLFGFVQIASTRWIEALLAMGCIDRRPEWLARQAADLIADDTALAGLDDTEVDRLRSLVPALGAMCRKLAAGPVPNGLVHGDLHLANVARRGDDYVFFDWTDACVTHPFLDLIDVFREEDLAVRGSLRDAYLSVWTEFASRAVLLELWNLAAPLASLNQAVSYRFIAANVEPELTQELEGALPQWLRRVLEEDVEALRV